MSSFARCWTPGAFALVCVALLAVSSSVPTRAGEILRVVVSGRVVGESGQGLADAEVRMVEPGRRLTTGADGVFRFVDIAPGRYTLTVRRSGYAPAVRTLALESAPDGAVGDLALALTPFTIEPIEITATRAALDPDRSPLPVDLLSGDALRNRTTVSLAHSIERVPGVRTLSTGAQVGKPVVRGLTGARVRVLDDSHPLEDYSWSDEDGPSIDARLAERVEVVRGPGSLIYGSEALTGVVNAVPRPLPDARDGAPSIHTGFELMGGSNNQELAATLRLEGASQPLGWRTTVIGRRAEDLHTPDGDLKNTGFEALNGDAAIGMSGEAGDFTLRYARYGGEFKLLEAEGPASGEEEGPERKSSDDRIQLSASHPNASGRWEGRFQWQRHNLIEMADDPGSAPGSGKESEQFNLLLESWSFELARHSGSDGRHQTLGVSGLIQSNDSQGPIPLVPDAHTNSGALFAIEQFHNGAWDWLGGARVDMASVTADANADLQMTSEEKLSDSQLSADLGAVYHVSSALSVSANAGRAWRQPNLFELFSYGPHLGEARFEIGDPDLDPEFGWCFDGGVRLRTPRLRAELDGYYDAFENFLFIAPTGAKQDSLPVYQHRQAAATLAGTELSLECELLRALTLHGELDYVWGQNHDEDEPLPLVPPLRGVVGMTWQATGADVARRAWLGADLEMVDEQTRLSPLDTPTAAYALVGLEAGLGRPLFGHPVVLDVSVHNLGDVRYRDYLSRYKTFALDQGRNVMVRISTGM